LGAHRLAQPGLGRGELLLGQLRLLLGSEELPLRVLGALGLLLRLPGALRQGLLPRRELRPCLRKARELRDGALPLRQGALERLVIGLLLRPLALRGLLRAPLQPRDLRLLRLQQRLLLPEAALRLG